MFATRTGYLQSITASAARKSGIYCRHGKPQERSVRTSQQLHGLISQSSDSGYLVGVRAAQLSDSFESVTFFPLIPDLQHAPSTLVELMLAGY